MGCQSAQGCDRTVVDQLFWNGGGFGEGRDGWGGVVCVCVCGGVSCGREEKYSDEEGRRGGESASLLMSVSSLLCSALRCDAMPLAQLASALPYAILLGSHLVCTSGESKSAYHQAPQGGRRQISRACDSLTLPILTLSPGSLPFKSSSVVSFSPESLVYISFPPAVSTLSKAPISCCLAKASSSDSLLFRLLPSDDGSRRSRGKRVKLEGGETKRFERGRAEQGRAGQGRAGTSKVASHRFASHHVVSHHIAEPGKSATVSAHACRCAPPLARLVLPVDVLTPCFDIVLDALQENSDLLHRHLLVSITVNRGADMQHLRRVQVLALTRRRELLLLSSVELRNEELRISFVLGVRASPVT